MKLADVAIRAEAHIAPLHSNDLLVEDRVERRPLVSVVVPAYNEAAILHGNLSALCEYLNSLEREYRWEILLVNDGSIDETGELADRFAQTRDNVHVWLFTGSTRSRVRQQVLP